MSEGDLQDFLRAVRDVGAEHAATTEKARRFLHEEGVLTQTGQLAEPYASPKQPADAAPQAQTA
jgi:hypothetical protein